MMGEPLDEKGLRFAAIEMAKLRGMSCLDEVDQRMYGGDAAKVIRAYLSATALPDGMEVVAWQVEHGGGATFWNVEDNARRNAEATNGTAHALVRADQAQSALAAMRVERDRNATEYETVLNSYADENQRLHDRADTLEAQVQRLTEDNEALRERADQWDAWAEGLTPAEIGNGMAKQEARIKALEEALETVISAYDDCSGAEPSLSVLFRTIDIDARAILTQEMQMASKLTKAQESDRG